GKSRDASNLDTRIFYQTLQGGIKRLAKMSTTGPEAVAENPRGNYTLSQFDTIICGLRHLKWA
ncbi:MAG: hypothetical protein ACPGAF_09085, partial [Pseudohongiellaceae bacterium]